jgi:hypothetical protein
MPNLHQYPIYGQCRPGTNSYEMGGFGYGAYSGSGFGRVTPTNFAVAVKRDTVGALRRQAAGADAVGVAMLTTGRRRRGAVDMRAARILAARAKQLKANYPAAMARFRRANMRTSRITNAVLARGQFSGFGQGDPDLIKLEHTAERAAAGIAKRPGDELAASAGALSAAADQASAAGNADRARALREESTRLHGLARAAAAAGEHGEEGRARAEEVQEIARAEKRAAAIMNGAKGGIFGRGIPWDAKTGGEKVAVVGAGGGAAGGAAWMLGLL